MEERCWPHDNRFCNIGCITKRKQCSGSVTFWYSSGCGSGSWDPQLWLFDPDLAPAPDPALFVSDLQDGNKNYSFIIFLLTTFWRYIYTFFTDKKGLKKSQTGSVPQTNGSRSGRTKNKDPTDPEQWTQEMCSLMILVGNWSMTTYGNNKKLCVLSSSE